MSFSKNGKNMRYDKLNMSAESKERILNECLKVLDEEYEKESVSTVVGENTTDEIDLKRENIDELSLKRNEKIEKENEYNDWFKKVAVASFSIVATGAIIAGVMNYNKLNKGPKNAKETNTVQISSRETEESVSIVGETNKDEKNTDKNNKKNNTDNGNSNNSNENGDKNRFSNNQNGGDKKETTSNSKTESEITGAVSPGHLIKDRLTELSEKCYNSDGSLKEGYDKKTFTDASGTKVEIVGKDIIELSSTQDKGAYDVDTNSSVIYFVCDDCAYQVVLDAACVHKDAGKYKKVSSSLGDTYDYLFKTGEGVKYYHNAAEDEYYIVDENSGKSRKVFDEIKIKDAPISGISYDWARGQLKFTIDKMGNQQADYNLPGIKCYKMGCFDEEGSLVKEISIVEDSVGGNHYYNVINDIDNECIYFVSGDNKLYRIDNVNFNKFSKIYSKSTIRSIKNSYPSIFNDHTCQFDEDEACLGLLRSIISVNAGSKVTLLAEDVRYIKTKSNEYIQTTKLDEKIIVVPTAGNATVVEEDDKVTY